MSAAAFRTLSPGGSFVFSVEHPVVTALAAPWWRRRPIGERLHWPVDDYPNEGLRRTGWIGENVVKYDRTISTYVNSLIGEDFRIAKVLEPVPTAEMAADDVQLKDERPRLLFLLTAALRPG